MSKPIYSNNYRRNLILYWRQYFPNWSIPKGYHVHHIKPKSLGGTHHPSNLIALHPDDHASIHKCRGDKWSSCGILSLKGKQHPPHVLEMLKTNRKGMKNSPEHKHKCSIALSGREFSEEWKMKLSKNHADVSGSNNPRSKTWQVTSPSGKVTIINGTMTQFCQKHNLPASVMRTIGRTGKLPKTGKCVGWNVKLLEI